MNKSPNIKTVAARAVSVALLSLILILTFSLSCSEENGMSNAFLNQRKESASYVTDARDGKKYRTAKVGNLNWTAENIGFQTVNSWCYDGISANCDKYGRLYAWKDAAYSVCPSGWHLPTEAEWDDLEEAASDNMTLLKVKSLGGNDTHGWSALPGGFRRSVGTYGGLGEDGYWWTAAEKNADTARARAIEWVKLDDFYNQLRPASLNKGNGESVRCVEDDGSVKRYTLTFDANGGPGVYDAMTVNSGATVRLPLVDWDEKWVVGGKSYRFKGWTDEGGSVINNWENTLTVTKSAALKAMWVLQVRLTFETDGGTPSQIGPWERDSGDVFEYIPLVKAGHAFVGWFSGNEEYTAKTVLTKNAALTARWRAAPSYTVTFDTDGGVPGGIASEQVDSGSTLVTSYWNKMPANPTKAGHFFEGWFDGETRYDGRTIINGDVALTAKWRAVPKYTVAFNTDGGTPNIEAKQIDSGSTLAGSFPASPTKQGYYFGGWFDGNEQYYDKTIITKAVTLTAKWSAKPKYTVTFNTNGGMPSVIEQILADSGAAIGNAFPVNPAKSGYFFEGWFNGATRYTAQTAITSSVTLTANWRSVPKYTVTLNANGGTYSGVYSVQVDSGSALGSNFPANPSKTGYNFGGWYDGTTRYTATTAITKAVTLTAQWTTIPQFTVTFHGNGITAGSAPSAMSQDSGKAITLPGQGSMAVSLNSFGGWNTNQAGTGAKYAGESVYTVTRNITLYAVWSPITITEFTDERDGQTYGSVKIGAQTWMAKNLNYDDGGNSWCYGNSPDSCDKYGRLYDWGAAMSGFGSSTANPSGVQGICPDGWHLPSRAEWQTLVDYAGGSSTAGSMLKSTSGWYNNGNGIDAFGFSALPGGNGNRGSGGSVGAAGNNGYWWTATENGSDYAYYRVMNYNKNYGNDNVGEENNGKSWGISVRCVQD